MINTLLLNSEWDLCLDGARNLATVSGDYALAQNVACALRLFLGELWYDTSQGVPYLSGILGQGLNKGRVESALSDAAMAVPGVTSVEVDLTTQTSADRSARLLRGSVLINGTITVNF